MAPGDAGAQTTYILDKIAASIAALGGQMEDVVRTRIYLRDAAKWEPVSRAHGRVFGEIMPANTLIEAGDLIGDYEVEIEAEAIVRGLRAVPCLHRHGRAWHDHPRVRRGEPRRGR